MTARNAFLSGVLLTLIAVLGVVLINATSAAQGDTTTPASSEAGAPVSIAKSKVGFIDFGKVLSENENWRNARRKLNLSLLTDYEEFETTVQTQSNSLTDRMRQTRIGGPSWRDFMIQKVDLDLSLLAKRSVLAAEEVQQGESINRRHYDDTMEVVEQICKQRGITVLLNLFNTDADADPRVNLQAKVMDDNVVWRATAEHDITKDVIEALKKLYAAESGDGTGSGENPTEGASGVAPGGTEAPPKE